MPHGANHSVPLRNVRCQLGPHPWARRVAGARFGQARRPPGRRGGRRSAFAVQTCSQAHAPCRGRAPAARCCLSLQSAHARRAALGRIRARRLPRGGSQALKLHTARAATGAGCVSTLEQPQSHTVQRSRRGRTSPGTPDVTSDGVATRSAGKMPARRNVPSKPPFSAPRPPIKRALCDAAPSACTLSACSCSASVVHSSAAPSAMSVRSTRVRPRGRSTFSGLLFCGSAASARGKACGAVFGLQCAPAARLLHGGKRAVTRSRNLQGEHGAPASGVRSCAPNQGRAERLAYSKNRATEAGRASLCGRVGTQRGRAISDCALSTRAMPLSVWGGQLVQALFMLLAVQTRLRLCQCFRITSRSSQQRQVPKPPPSRCRRPSSCRRCSRRPCRGTAHRRRPWRRTGAASGPAQAAS